jgi:UDP-N-acetylglucosamine--N-acetylmuramyl-(pentapeptide) pyrophosphoryl-undecaprenol N-acetylglucosamine transferase
VRILIAAGGTGGHIVPALAVAEVLAELGHEVSFVGVGKEIEKKLIKNYPLAEISFPPFRGQGLGGIYRLVRAIPGAVMSARKLIRERQIDRVIGFGGYPSFAPIVAAWLLGIPRVLHEQNRVVGLANRWLSRIVSVVFATQGVRGFSVPVIELPLPVRKAFREIPPLSGKEKPCLLVLGGSQGAVSVNTAVLSLGSFLKERGVGIIHQAGRVDYQRVKDGYASMGVAAEVYDFVEDVAGLMARSTMIISRAGAMSVAEISASGRPAIYIPLPIAGGHQQDNCREVVARGEALLVLQDGALNENLRVAVLKMLDRVIQVNHLRAEEMHPEKLIAEKTLDL